MYRINTLIINSQQIKTLILTTNDGAGIQFQWVEIKEGKFRKILKYGLQPNDIILGHFNEGTV